MTPGQDRSDTRFPATQWSMIAAQPGTRRAADAREALVHLCVRYWYPVYAYVRRCGHSPPIAEDIARTFLQHLFEHFRDDGTAHAGGQFRRYLLAHLDAFLTDDWRSAVAGEVIPELATPPADLELRNQHDNARTESPAQAYEQSFALEVLARALVRLREEARETNHLDMYEALAPFIASEPAAGQHEDLARRLRTKPVALIVAIRRLRQRFRELADAELADLVASPEELLVEQGALHAALRRMQEIR